MLKIARPGLSMEFCPQSHWIGEIDGYNAGFEILVFLTGPLKANRINVNCPKQFLFVFSAKTMSMWCLKIYLTLESLIAKTVTCISSSTIKNFA